MSFPTSENPQSEIRNPQSSIIESPWLWVLLFSVFGLVLLSLFSPKYHDLQALRERHYQAQERVAEKMAAEKNNPGGTQRIDDLEARRPFATPDNNLIKLWPLTALMGLIAIVAAAMLYRRWQQIRSFDGDMKST